MHHDRPPAPGAGPPHALRPQAGRLAARLGASGRIWLLLVAVAAGVDHLHRHATGSLVVAVGALAAAWSGGVAARQARREVSSTLAAVLALAEGMGLEELPAGGDEFTRIGRALTVVAQAQEARAEQLGQAAERLVEQEQAAFVHQRFTEKQSRTRAQEVVDDSSTAIVTRLAEVEDQVGSVRSSTETIDEKVLAATEATRDMLARAAQADHAVEALEGSLRSVESMATIIAQVADQTKLLALNATIEAARAGAAGDGFRVVAAEVKDLAATTGRSTQEIATTVADVQSSADAVLRSLRSMQERIGSIDEASEGLRLVAARQRDAVGHLQGSVAAAVEGAQGMSRLAATMERRRVERFPCRQDLVVTVEGRRFAGTGLDLGRGGAKVTLPGQLAGTFGIGRELVVHWPHRGAALALPATVARCTATAGGVEVGVVFEPTGPSEAAGVREVIAALEATFDALAR